MPTYAIVLIVLGIVLVVGALAFVIYKYGAKNPAVAGGILGVAASVFSYLKGIFKDDPTKLDAHDFMVMFGALSKVGLEALELKKEGKPFAEAQILITEKVQEIVKSVPSLQDNISEETVGSIVKIIFDVLGYVPLD